MLFIILLMLLKLVFGINIIVNNPLLLFGIWLTVCAIMLKTSKFKKRTAMAFGVLAIFNISNVFISFICLCGVIVNVYGCKKKLIAIVLSLIFIMTNIYVQETCIEENILSYSENKKYRIVESSEIKKSIYVEKDVFFKSVWISKKIYRTNLYGVTNITWARNNEVEISSTDKSLNIINKRKIKNLDKFFFNFW